MPVYDGGQLRQPPSALLHKHELIAGRRPFRLTQEQHGCRQAQNARVRNSIPRARFVSIPQSGHLPQIEQPDMTQSAMIGFLAEGASRARTSLFHQGVDMGRPGLLTIDIPADAGTGIAVTGTAVAI